MFEYFRSGSVPTVRYRTWWVGGEAARWALSGMWSSTLVVSDSYVCGDLAIYSAAPNELAFLDWLYSNLRVMAKVTAQCRASIPFIGVKIALSLADTCRAHSSIGRAEIG